MDEPNFYAKSIPLVLTWLVLSGLFISYRAKVFLISKKQLLAIFSRLIITWLAFFFFYTYCHLFIIKTLLPVFSFLLNHIQSEYLAALSSIEKATEAIQINIKILHDIPPLKAGIEFFQFFYFLTILQQMALLPAILIAWPVNRFYDRFILFIMSIFLSLVLLMLTVPFLMAGQFESTFTALSNVTDTVRPDPYYHGWLQFITNDGHFIVIIIMVVFASKIQRKFTRHPHSINIHTS